MGQTYTQFIKAQGYRVFVRGPEEKATYCYFTDGTRIAYAQWPYGRPKVLTVHMPCHSFGTGFEYANEITAESLKGALIYHKPSWAFSDHMLVKKYRGIEAFLKSSKFNSEYVEI